MFYAHEDYSKLITASTQAKWRKKDFLNTSANEAYSYIYVTQGINNSRRNCAVDTTSRTCSQVERR